MADTFRKSQALLALGRIDLEMFMAINKQWTAYGPTDLIAGPDSVDLKAAVLRFAG